jgi:hypothetical protein
MGCRECGRCRAYFFNVCMLRAAVCRKTQKCNARLATRPAGKALRRQRGDMHQLSGVGLRNNTGIGIQDNFFASGGGLAQLEKKTRGHKRSLRIGADGRQSRADDVRSGCHSATDSRVRVAEFEHGTGGVEWITCRCEQLSSDLFSTLLRTPFNNILRLLQEPRKLFF